MYRAFRDGLESFVDDENGATAIEYGLVATLVALIIIQSLRTVGTNLTASFRSISSALALASR